MIKVHQTIINNKNGNCMQAAVASLLELNLDEVPKFIEHEIPYQKFFEFFYEKDIHPIVINYNYINENNEVIFDGIEYEDIKKLLKHDGGFNGYFYATVKSKLYNGTHAVIIDTDMNIVHDVNPNGLYLDLTYNDIISIILLYPDKYEIDINNNVILK